MVLIVYVLQVSMVQTVRLVLLQDFGIVQFNNALVVVIKFGTELIVFVLQVFMDPIVLLAQLQDYGIILFNNAFVHKIKYGKFKNAYVSKDIMVLHANLAFPQDNG